MDPFASPEPWGRVISAAVVPVVMISACGLLCLAFYNRLTAVLARIRAFQAESLHEHEELLQGGSEGETQRRVRRLTRATVEMLRRQLDQLLARARLIRNTLAALLCAIGCLVAASLGAGAAVFWPASLYAAGLSFLAGLGCMLAGVGCALLELRMTLAPVEVGQEFVERLTGLLPPEASP
jgi:hypothetical protein